MIATASRRPQLGQTPVSRLAPHIGQGVGLLRDKPDHLLAGIGVVRVLQQQIPPAGPVNSAPSWRPALVVNPIPLLPSPRRAVTAGFR